ncbi:MAG TPA: hypothetical protein PLG87_01975 [Treponemataceae bacterium]|nr:hypothetical protein [Treponemataceae bacterium]
MKKLKALYKKIIQSVLALIGIGTLTACYGSPPPAGFIEGSVHFTDDDGTEQPIKDIQVQLQTDGAVYDAYTGTDGSFLLQSFTYAENPVTITFTDTDGEANGGEFTSKTLNPPASSVYDTAYNVALEKK